ncbi:MAG: extracellular solute-binding protein [bacterium]
MKTRYISGLLFVVIAALPYALMVVTGRHNVEPAAAKPETLVIISPHRREVRLEYSRAFRAWMKDRHNRAVEISWVDVGGTQKINKYLESQFSASADGIGVDLLFGGGVSPYLVARRNGWLQSVDLPPGTLDNIPALCAGLQVYDPEHYWHGVALSGFGIVYNRTVLRRLGLSVPLTWEDLAAPAFFTWLASGDPRSSGSVHKCYEIILQAYGFEKGWGIITRICANVHRFGEGGGAAPLETAMRDVAAGMAIDQYAETVVRLVGRDVLGFVLPADVTVMDADAIGLLRGAPSPELARTFIEFALSEEGQQVLYQPAGVNGQQFALNRMPVRKSCYDTPGGPAARPYEQGSGLKFDARKESARRDIVAAMIGVFMIDAHSELAAAWKRVIADGMRPDDVSRLCKPPVAESDLLVLSKLWGDPREKARISAEWSAVARRRYRAIEQGSGETRQ